jgi:hypothetical protein
MDNPGYTSDVSATVEQTGSIPVSRTTYRRSSGCIFGPQYGHVPHFG